MKTSDYLPSIPDRTSRVLNSDVDPVLTESSTSNVLDLNGGSSEVGSHGKVSDGSGEANGGSEFVEGTLTDGPGEGETEEDDGGKKHDGEDSPQPVRCMCCDIDVGDELCESIQREKRDMVS